MASQYDIKLDQGATFEQAFVWNDVGPPKTAIDLTNYTARMQVRKSHEEEDTILDVSDTDPEITLGGPCRGSTSGSGITCRICAPLSTSPNVATLRRGALSLKAARA